MWDVVGRGHLELFDRLARVVERKEQLGTVVEWGCGGGANAVSFAPRCSSFVGVDISQDSLDECARQVTGGHLDALPLGARRRRGPGSGAPPTRRAL